MSDIIIREYQGTKIRQRADGYLCLTDMATAAGKRVAHWRANAVTDAFLAALSTEAGIPASELVALKSRGVDQGTWAHPQVAHHFAMWCSPEFAVRVTGWVEDIRTKGFAGALPDLRDPKQLAVIALQLTGIVTEQNVRLAIAEPKAEVYDRITASTGLIGLMAAGKIVGERLGGQRTGHGPRQMIALWGKHGILHKLGGKWVPGQGHEDSGRFEVKCVPGEDGDRSHVQTFVTPCGLQWLARRYCPESQIRFLGDGSCHS